MLVEYSEATNENGRDAAAAQHARPILLVFHSQFSGACRRVEGFLAQILQRRRNHETFRVCHVDSDVRPDLMERFRVQELPTLIVVEERRISARLEQPRGCRAIEGFLSPWLR